MKTTISGISINPSKQILLVQKQGTRILPGGKVELDQPWQETETHLQTLQRECSEELRGLIVDTSTSKYYKTFSGITPHSARPMNVETYFINIPHENEIYPSAEIKDAQYHKPEDIYQRCSQMTQNIITTLQHDGLL